MQRIPFKTLFSVMLVAVLVGACAPPPLVSKEEGGIIATPRPEPAAEPEAPAEPPAVAEEPALPRIDPMADVPGDRPAPVAVGKGALERIDCKHGVEDLHARMAFEARGGQIANFAYYSKWKPRTCAFDFARNSPGTKWRLTRDGATRVHTPEGRFLIRTRSDAYVFEFEQVQRGRFCGMPGEINGSMTITRGRKNACTVSGILDTKDPLLDALHKR